MQGWISLYRKFKDWEWYNDNNMVKLFIHLLLSANHKDNTWRNIDIKKGQYLTGLKQLSNDTNITIQTLRTCLKRLEKTNEIITKSTNKYRIITICNYDCYQNIKTPTNKQVTSKQQTSNKQLTTNNNDNNNNNDNKLLKPKDHYKLEYEKSKQNGSHKDFIKFINVLFGKNDLEFELEGVLSIPKQISYKQFEKLKLLKAKNNRTMADILTEMENNPKYWKNRKSLYRCMLTWYNNTDKWSK